MSTLALAAATVLVAAGLFLALTGLAVMVALAATPDGRPRPEAVADLLGTGLDPAEGVAP